MNYDYISNEYDTISTNLLTKMIFIKQTLNTRGEHQNNNPYGFDGVR